MTQVLSRGSHNFVGKQSKCPIHLILFSFALLLTLVVTHSLMSAQQLIVHALFEETIIVWMIQPEVMAELRLCSSL